MENSGIIYLLSCCSTANDENNYPRMLGQHEFPLPLSTLGIRQAGALATFLAARDVSHVYSSPMMRAVQTTRIIGESLATTPTTFVTSLTDVDVGDWTGATLEQAMDDPRYDLYIRDPGTYGYPNGESLSAVARRAVSWIEKIAQKHYDERVVLVSHPEVNRAVLAHLCSVPMYRIRELDQVPGCLNLIRVFRGSLELQAVNYTDNFDLAEEEDEPCASVSSVPVL